MEAFSSFVYLDMKGFRRSYQAVVALALCSAWPLGVQAQEISTVSPFLPQSSGAVGAVTENSPIELRGILAIPGGSLFGLFDPVKKQGGWVKLNESGHDYTVRTYDATNDAVTVEYQGRVVSLALKTAKIESMPAMAMAQPPRPMAGPQQMATAPTVDEAKRLEAVAAEVQRRRMQRQAAMQQAAQGPGQPRMPMPPQPMPQPMPPQPMPPQPGR